MKRMRKLGAAAILATILGVGMSMTTAKVEAKGNGGGGGGQTVCSTLQAEYASAVSAYGANSLFAQLIALAIQALGC